MFDTALSQAHAMHAMMMSKKYNEPLAALGPRPTVPPALPAPKEQKAVSDGAETRSAALWLTRLFETAAKRGVADFEKDVRAAYKQLAVRKVDITMEQMSVLRDQVNDHLAANNGGRILKMAYEEVLYPVLFTGKKKYAGIAHVYGPNFDIPGPEKMFIRGIDIVKQGQTKLARVLGNQCLWEAAQLNPPGTRVPYIDRVEKVIDDCCKGMSSFKAGDVDASGKSLGTGTGTVHWTLDDFVQTDAWKPDKKNISVQTFMARMRRRHNMQLAENETRETRGEPLAELDYVEPEAGSRFAYVIVDNGPTTGWTRQGYSKGSTSKGDLMEYVHVAKKRNLRINVQYYLEHYVVGLCARFINYAPQFDMPLPPGAEPDPKKADEYAQRKAKLHLTSIVRNINKTSRGDTARIGRAYRKAYKSAAGKVAEALFDGLVDDPFAAEGAMLLTGGFSGDLIGSYKREVEDLAPHERAKRGVVDYSLFLGDGPSDEQPEAYAMPVAGALRLAAHEQAKRVFARLNEPAPAWDAAAATHLRPDLKGSWRTAIGHSLAALGVNPKRKASENRLRVIELLNTFRPTRQSQRRAAAGAGRPAIAVMQDAWTEQENHAYLVVEDRAPRLMELSSRVQASLEELVDIERSLSADTPDAPIDAAAASVAELRVAKALKCTDSEAAMLREVRAAWHNMTAVALQRIVHAELVAELERVRDAGL